MNEFEFMLATTTDLVDILEFNKSFAHEYKHDLSFFDEGIISQRVFVARKDSQLAGYLIWQVIWGNTPFLALIRVAPPFRGKGLGTSLLKLCEKKLKAGGYKALVSSSEASNQEGRDFHRKKGFREIGIVEMGYGPEVFYRKVF
jgi:ribosomal protein S18 acetylase RimI-like enzyme